MTVLLLSGCAKSEKTIVTNGQRYFATTEWNNQTIECNIKTENDICTFDLLKPDQLNGMKITVEQGNSKISYLGLEFLGKQNKTICSIAELLSDVFKKCDNTQTKNGKIEGESYGYKWTVLTDEKGNLKEIVSDDVVIKLKNQL